jgi:hypothetical protein
MTEKDWLLLEAIDRVGIRGTAKRDAYRRGVEYFQDRDFDAIGAHDFYHRDLRSVAPHLWQTGTPPTDTRTTQQPNGTQEKIDWSKLLPAERLTRFREQQAQQDAQQRR